MGIIMKKKKTTNKKLEKKKQHSNSKIFSLGFFVAVDNRFNIQSINIVPHYIDMSKYLEERENNRQRFLTLSSNEEIMKDLNRIKSSSQLAQFYNINEFLQSYGNNITRANREISERARLNNRSFLAELFNLTNSVDEPLFLIEEIKLIYSKELRYAAYIVNEIIYNLTLLDIPPSVILAIDYFIFFLPTHKLVSLIENVKNDRTEKTKLIIRLNLIEDRNFYEKSYILNQLGAPTNNDINNSDVLVTKILCALKYNVQGENLSMLLNKLISIYNSENQDSYEKGNFLNRIYRIFYLSLSVGNKEFCIDIFKKGIWKSTAPLFYNAMLEILFYSPSRETLFGILEYLFTQEEEFQISHIFDFIIYLPTDEARTYVRSTLKDFLNDFLDRTYQIDREFYPHIEELIDSPNIGETTNNLISSLSSYIYFSSKEEIQTKFHILKTAKLLSISQLNILSSLLLISENRFLDAQKRKEIIDYFFSLMNELIPLYHQVNKNYNQIIGLIGYINYFYKQNLISEEQANNIIKRIINSNKLTLDVIAATYTEDNHFRSLYHEDIKCLILALNESQRTQNLKSFIIEGLNKIDEEHRESFVRQHSKKIKKFFETFNVNLEDYKEIIETQETNEVNSQSEEKKIKKTMILIEEKREEKPEQNNEIEDNEGFERVSRKRNKEKNKPIPKTQQQILNKQNTIIKAKNIVNIAIPKSASKETSNVEDNRADNKQQISVIIPKQTPKNEQKISADFIPGDKLSSNLPEIMFGNFGNEEKMETEKLIAEIERLKSENDILKKASIKTVVTEKTSCNVYPIYGPDGTFYYYREERENTKVVETRENQRSEQQTSSQTTSQRSDNKTNGQSSLATVNKTSDSIFLTHKPNKNIDLRLYVNLENPKVKDSNKEYNDAKTEVEENIENNDKINILQRKNITAETREDYLGIEKNYGYPVIFVGIDRIKADFIYNENDPLLNQIF